MNQIVLLCSVKIHFLERPLDQGLFKCFLLDFLFPWPTKRKREEKKGIHSRVFLFVNCLEKLE